MFYLSTATTLAKRAYTRSDESGKGLNEETSFHHNAQISNNMDINAHLTQRLNICGRCCVVGDQHVYFLQGNHSL